VHPKNFVSNVLAMKPLLCEMHAFMSGIMVPLWREFVYQQQSEKQYPALTLLDRL